MAAKETLDIKISESETVTKRTADDDKANEPTVAERELAAALAAAQVAAAETIAAQEEPEEVDYLKPVVVYYDEDAEPDDLHPSGVARGTMYQSATPQGAREFHPKGRILHYADGTPYNKRKATIAIRESEETGNG